LKARTGFEYWNEDGGTGGFWFCRHCGSNHVTVIGERHSITKAFADLRVAEEAAGLSKMGYPIRIHFDQACKSGIG